MLRNTRLISHTAAARADTAAGFVQGGNHLGKSARDLQVTGLFLDSFHTQLTIETVNSS